MLCHQLAGVLHNFLIIEGRSHISAVAILIHGSTMPEPRLRPGASFHPWELDAIHTGMDDSINHMLAGGNGFPACQFQTHMAATKHALGTTQERRDLRSLLAWTADFQLCLADRRAGKVG